MVDFTVAPLPGQAAFGAVINGLTEEAISEPDVRQALHDLWIDKGVLVFKDLTSLDSQLRLSEIFGESWEHPLLVGVDRKREHKSIADIDYHPGEGDIYEIEGEVRGGYLPWHFDLAYMEKINRGGILRPHVLPRHGGETGFIDRIAAYARLPEALKARIEGLDVIHAFATDASQAKFGSRPDRCLRLSRNIVMAASHPSVQRRVVHPLVYIQKETGRKVLNISPWHAIAVEGMDESEGDALLSEVVDHAIRPEGAYFHKWQANDMVLWDNWRMLHCAVGVPAGEERRMRRTTISGDYALGRRLGAEAVSA